MKGRGFDKLRIAAASAVPALASLFGAVTRTARASTALPLTVGSSTRWQLASSNCADAFGLPGATCGLGLRQFAPPGNTTLPTTYVAPPTTFMPPPTSAPPGTTGAAPPTSAAPPPTSAPPSSSAMAPPTSAPPSEDDLDGKRLRRTKRLRAKDVGGLSAFNNSLGVSVGGHVFQAPGGRVTLAGDSASAGPAVLGGVSTRVQYRFFDAARTVRAVFTLTNPGAAPVELDVRTDIGGFGGGSDIALDSGGTAQLSPRSRWHETTGASSGSIAPSVLFVDAGVSGVASLHSIARVTVSNGVQRDIASYRIKLGAGETQALMAFAQANAGVQDATTVEATFSDLYTLDQAGLLADLPLPPAQILNWKKLVLPLPLGKPPPGGAK